MICLSKTRDIVMTSIIIKTMVFLGCACISAIGVADTVSKTICNKKQLTRYISHRTFESDGAPCDVLYEKPTEGGYAESEWAAQNDALFCEERYQDFVSKLRELGWSCSQSEFSSPQSKIPILKITVPEKLGRLSIYDQAGAFVGYANDFFQLNEGINKFVIHGPTQSRLSIVVEREEPNRVVVQSSTAYDGIGMCPDRKVSLPTTVLNAWPIRPIRYLKKPIYEIKMGVPSFKPRPSPECFSIPSEIGGLKWNNTILTIESNVTNAEIYQKNRSGNYNVVEGVFPGVRFSAVHHEFAREVHFVLRKPGYANCMLTVGIPATSTRFRCDLIDVQTLLQ